MPVQITRLVIPPRLPDYKEALSAWKSAVEARPLVSNLMLDVTTILEVSPLWSDFSDMRADETPDPHDILSQHETQVVRQMREDFLTMMYAHETLQNTINKIEVNIKTTTDEYLTGAECAKLTEALQAMDSVYACAFPIQVLDDELARRQCDSDPQVLLTPPSAVSL